MAERRAAKRQRAAVDADRERVSLDIACHMLARPALAVAPCCCNTERSAVPPAPFVQELEAQLFGRDEEALQQLGTELGGGGGDGGGGSLSSDFLASYQQGAAAAAAADGSDDDDEERQQRGSAGGLVMFEDRGGADAQPAAAARRRRQAVWEDPQDAALRVNVAAKSQLRKLRREEEETELTGEAAEGRGWRAVSGGREQGCLLHHVWAWGRHQQLSLLARIPLVLVKGHPACFWLC